MALGPQGPAAARCGCRGSGGIGVRAILAALGLVVIATAGAIAQAPDGAALPPPLDTPPEVRAQLTPRQYTTLSGEIAARIDRIATRIGDRFVKGAVLVEFDCDIPRAQLARAEAVVTQTEKTVAINRRLAALKSIGQLELELAQAEMKKARAERDVAQATTAKCTIAAPFTGITVEQKVRESQFVAAGTPLLDIVDNSRLEVELIAPSRWLGFLRPGFAFDVQIDELGRSYRAKVDRLSGRVDPVSQSIKVIGSIDDPAPELMAGMSGAAIIRPPP